MGETLGLVQRLAGDHGDKELEGLVNVFGAGLRATLRAVAGILVDHLKPKKAGVTGQLIVLSGLAWAQFGGISSFQQILVLGMAGAAFAVALPSRTPLAARAPLLLWRSIAVIALILNLILLYLLSAR